MSDNEDICGVEQVINGKTWICVKPVHDAMYTRKKGDRTHRVGEPVMSNSHVVEQHYFVRKRPYGTEKAE